MKSKFFFSVMTAVVVMTSLTGCSSKATIDFKDCVSVEFYGYNGEGTASPQGDYNYILSLLGDMNTMTAAGIVSSFSFEEVRNNGSLSNGDIITVTITANEDMLKNAKVNVKNTDLQFIVKGLEEKPVKDVFADVSLIVNGTSPYCTVSAMYGGTQYIMGGYQFDITSADGAEKEYYQNGDVVAVTLTENARQSLEQNYVLEEISRNYVVQAENKYIMTADDLNNSVDNIEIMATDYIDDAVHNIKAARIKVLSGISGVGEGTLYANSWSLSVDNLTFNSAYVGTSSNKGIFGDITYTPCIYFFYNADFTYKTSSRGSENTANGIIAVKMNNPKISNDGKITYEEISVVSSSTDVDDYKSAIESFEKLF